ncbi:dienelactone hydrolase [Phenylobacterium sp. Root77]|jgi:carboxymethylenebutenolidase|uniref:dienelactone hydrolase family protein n=1 Tax=unclassified Phenylobacterium TaxID=2640670 RepID=UPI0006FD57A3|nr:MULTISPECIES: dienelactone hydrolase family protein [unclassified Phenylobacterium]KQW73271.1 dienelactone hydrolase [Phenylobacterium sp. Root1277]KQW92491.1 dienelactone hydrolase [Phenylobacterium sp. Root1290]KRC40720.1 dienelactone hydrolase [Phenylobacterium sp. Root77]
MCDDDIHQGLIEDPTVSRRTFGLMTVAAAGLTAASAHAAVPVVEKDVEIKTPDGVADAALYYPEGKGSWPAVLLWPDVVSLRPVFREMGKRLAASGYVVLVPNLYYRVKKAPVVDGGFNFANADDRAKLAPLRASVTPEGTDRDAVAYLAYLDAQPQTDKNKKVGTQGYCMGGPLAFRTAGAVPGRVGAVASFHGGGLFTDAPTSPHLVLPKTQAEYMVLVADNDDKQDPAAKEKVKGALDAAKLKNRVEVYEGAAHGWTVKGSQVYNEPAAEKAWAELLDLYKRAL